MEISADIGREGGRISLGSLIRDLFLSVSELINTQIELVKTEVRVEGQKLALAALFGIVTLLMGMVFSLLLALSLFLLFASLMEAVWASMLTTAIFFLMMALFGFLMVREIRKNSETIDIRQTGAHPQTQGRGVKS